MSAHMQIGEVAERTRLSLRTIRYYEEVGLVPPSARSQGGFRLYTESDVTRLLLVRSMKPLEFSLEEMRDLLAVLDGLTAAGDDDRRRDELVDRLRMYGEAAQARVLALTEALDDARAFSSMLGGQISRQKSQAQRR